MGQGEDAVARGGQYPRPPVCVVRAGGGRAAPARPVDTPGEASGNPAGRRVLPGRRGPPAGGAGRSVAQAQ